MSLYRVVSLPTSDADVVRRTRADAHGNVAIEPLIAEPDSGLPCRVCLEDVAAGESAYLFSWAAIDRPRPYRFVGPVVVHAESCRSYAGSELPPMLNARLLSVRSFDAQEDLIEAEVLRGTELAEYAEKAFADPRVQSLHLHTARRGCYLCRLERR